MDELRALLTLLIYRSKRAITAHYKAANHLQTLERFGTGASVLGGILVTFTGVYVEFIRESVGIYGGIISVALSGVGLILLLIAVGQSVWRWGERAQEHRKLASGYSTVRRRLEFISAQLTISSQEVAEVISDLDRLSSGAQLVPPWAWPKEAREGR